MGDEFWATNHEATSNETYRRSVNQALMTSFKNFVTFLSPLHSSQINGHAN